MGKTYRWSGRSYKYDGRDNSDLISKSENIYFKDRNKLNKPKFLCQKEIDNQTFQEQKELLDDQPS